MPTRRKAERDQWVVVLQLPRGGYRLIELESGGSFPPRMVAYGNYAGGPNMKLVFEVEAGRPVLRSLTVGDGAFENDLTEKEKPPLTASAVHDLPLGQIVEWTITTAVLQMELVKKAFTARIGDPLFTPEDEEIAERLRRVVSVRGRPVDDEILRRVAEIVRSNRFDYREDIKSELHVSDRTASRWVAAAKSRGFLNEGSDQ